MPEKIGRYDCDIIREQLTQHPDILSDLVRKPRGANGNKDGRAFELAYATYLIICEIACIFRSGAHHKIPVSTLRSLGYNDRPICLVDDSHLVGLSGESYAQLKLGELKWPEVEPDFRAQIDLDAVHELRIEYRLILGSPRNIEHIQKKLRAKGLGRVVAKAYSFPPEYLHRISINNDLKSAVTTITGSSYPEWSAAAYGKVMNAVEQSRRKISFISLMRDLHIDSPHLFHPLEEQYVYDYLVDLIKAAAPDVTAEICGPALKLSEWQSREVYTIPWGNDELIDAFAQALEEFEDGDADKYLCLADIEWMLRQADWVKAVPPIRTRPFMDLESADEH